VALKARGSDQDPGLAQHEAGRGQHRFKRVEHDELSVGERAYPT
jgi:hypothetical protein